MRVEMLAPLGVILLLTFPAWAGFLWHLGDECWDKFGPGAGERRGKREAQCQEAIARMARSRAENEARYAKNRAKWLADEAERKAESVARKAAAREARYGERHRAERAKYADVIRQHGGHCMERICVMPSLRIAPGAFWHLAHDHESGGPHDYRGPAHPACNEAEARARGVVWTEEAATEAIGSDPWADLAETSPVEPWGVTTDWDDEGFDPLVPDEPRSLEAPAWASEPGVAHGDERKPQSEPPPRGSLFAENPFG